jgi:hypothetical protein
MRLLSLPSAIRILTGALLLTWPAPAAFAQRCALGAEAAPRGVVALLASGEKNYRMMNLAVVKNPFASGVAVQINWRDIEPARDAPDWSKLDALFAAAEAEKKWVHVMIFAGFFSPPWALEDAETDLFKIPYGPGHGEVARLAMPWDRTYLDRWFAFVRRLGERYGRSPAFRMIGAGGPTSVSEEMSLPNAPPAHRRWLAHGYTQAKYIAAWEETFRVFAEAFPNQCVSLSAPGVPILAPARRRGPAARMRAKHEMVERAMRVLGDRLAIQSSDLHAGRAAHEAPDGTRFIKGYSGRIVTGFEMRSGSQSARASKVMGAAGDPPLALRRSIDKGMAPNAAGRRVDYLEIYEADVGPPDMQPVLRYAASLFRQ